MSRKMLVAGNWKMNLRLSEATELATALGAGVRNVDAPEVAVFPPFPWLLPVRDALAGSGVRVGAQHCHDAVSGAFTGEVSATMLAEVCDYVLAGHSERRHLFGESDALVGSKVNAVLAAGLPVILCVGETLEERRGDLADAVVTRQLAGGLAGVTDDQMARVTIAYEPVWAIGTGVAATADDAQEMAALVRQWLGSRWGERGTLMRVLYGGSVAPQNARELFVQPDVDGGLVGGASLKADSFLAIVDAARQVSAGDF